MGRSYGYLPALSSTKIALQWKWLPFRVHPGSLQKSLHICSTNPSPTEKKAPIDCTVMLYILLFLAVTSLMQLPKRMETTSRFPELHKFSLRRLKQIGWL